jgi:hypothetical protein
MKSREHDGTYRRDVAQLVLLAGEDLSENAAHDLAGSRLWQVGDDVDGLGGGEGADAPADLENKVLAQVVVDGVSVLESDKGVDGLAGELIGHTDDGGLCDGGMLEEGGLDLGGGQTVAGDVDDVVDASADPVKALVVAAGTIAGELGGVSGESQTWGKVART